MALCNTVVSPVSNTWQLQAIGRTHDFHLVLQKYKSAFWFPEYVVILSDINKNILINTDDPTLVRCTVNTETNILSNLFDIRKRWKCPCGSVGRYVYLFFKNPSEGTAVCEVEVYADDTPCISIRSCEYITVIDQSHTSPWASCQIRKFGGLRMRRKRRERFLRNRWLAIPTCITARAQRTYRDVCLDR